MTSDFLTENGPLILWSQFLNQVLTVLFPTETHDPQVHLTFKDSAALYCPDCFLNRYWPVKAVEHCSLINMHEVGH